MDKWYVFYVKGDHCVTEEGMEDFSTKEEAFQFAHGLVEEDRSTCYHIVQGQLLEVCRYGRILPETE